VLAKAPHEHVFGTEFIINIVEHFWPVYFYQVLRKVTVPYLVYWLCTVFYFSEEINKDFEAGELLNVKTREFWLRQLIFLGICYFFSIEVV
jgi:hypothetical protein